MSCEYQEFYTEDVGLYFIVDTGIDLSYATVTEILVLTPTGEVTWTASVVSGTTTVEYVTKAGDLAEPGVYYLQSRVEIAEKIYLGKPTVFKVFERFES